MADQINMQQKTAGQLIMDIEIHFEKNNVKTVAKEKLRRLGRIVPVWTTRAWYPQADEPMPSKEQIKLLRQRLEIIDDGMEEMSALVRTRSEQMDQVNRLTGQTAALAH